MPNFTRSLRRPGLSLAATFAIGVAAATFATASALAAAPDPVVTDLMTKVLADVPNKEVEMITVDYAPGAADPVHRHDAEAFVYVIEGSIVMGVKGGKEQTLGPGQIFYEGLHDVHTVGRNASKTRPARFVVFLVRNKGKPIFIPVNHP